MAQMAKNGTEGQAKNIIACTIFVCRPTKKLMVPMERLSLKDLFFLWQKILFHFLPLQNWGKPHFLGLFHGFFKQVYNFFG